MASSIFAFLLLFFLDAVVYSSNPVRGDPDVPGGAGVFFAGLVIFLFGAWRWRRQMAKANGAAPLLRINIDLSRPHDRRVLAFFVPASAGFLLLTAMGSYHTYHFTESVEFCGESCHTVMKPELTTYLHSPHARVACAECHIGKGATWYVRSKLSGTYQVYATLAHKYPTPIPTPVKNLRPAQETCEQCHWPKKFVGNLDRTLSYYLPGPVQFPLLRAPPAQSRRRPTAGGRVCNVANKIDLQNSPATFMCQWMPPTGPWVGSPPPTLSNKRIE